MKKPKTLKNLYKISEPELLITIKQWIEYIGLPEKKFIKEMKRQEKQWLKEYDQGKHRNDGYNPYGVWLGAVGNIYHKERAQVAILKKIFC